LRELNQPIDRQSSKSFSTKSGQSAISLQARKTERDDVGISTDGGFRTFAASARVHGEIK
jgi:hypothetical protein